MADNYDNENSEDDELKAQQNNGLLDDIEEVAGSALAIGAGAALLYRNGGQKVLSSGMAKMTKFLSKTGNEFANKTLGKDYTVSSAYKELFSNKDSIWKTVSKEVDDKGINIRTDNPNSLFGFLRSVNAVQENSSRSAREIFSGEVASQVSNEFMQKHGEDKVLANKIHSFISQTASNFLDPSAKEMAEDIFTEEESKKVSVNDIKTRMDELYKNTARFDEIKSTTVGEKDVMDSAISQALKINMDDAEKTFGSKTNETAAQKIKNLILGDRGLTVKEAIENAEKFNDAFKKRGSNKDSITESAISLLKDTRDKLDEKNKKRFDDLYVDSTLRTNKKGNIYSFKETAELTDKLLDHAAGTLPGTLLKLRDFQYINKAPHFAIFQANKANPLLARAAENSKDSVLKNNYMYILGKTYRINKDGSLNHIKEMDGTYLSSGRYGTMSHMYKAMFGDKSMKTSQNRYRKLFDFNLDGEENELDEQLSVIKKFKNKDWQGNVVNDFLDDINRTIMTKDKKQYILKTRELNSFFSKNVYELNKKSINIIKDNVLKNSTEYNILDNMNKDGDELLNHLLGKGENNLSSINRYKNSDLSSMLFNYLKDPIKAKQAIKVKADESHYFTGKQTDDFYTLLRIEATKEVFLQHADRHKSLNSVVDLLEKTNLKDRDKEKAKRIAYWSGLQYKTGITSRVNKAGVTEETWINDIVDNTQDIFSKNIKHKNARFNSELHKTLHNMQEENISIFESSRERRQGVLQEQQYSDFIHARKTIGPIDLIKSINNKTFKKTAEKLGKQFFAGRKSAENVTTATMIPYFMAERLSAALNTTGLGLSNLSTGNTVDIMSGLVLKRALPLMVGLTALDYMNDSTRQLTGTSMSTALLSGVSNVDLIGRKALDITGISSVLTTEKQVNPFMQYWFGKDDYQNYDARKDYYQNGYTEVRKGRFWSFGSSNEFRGGQIQYWMPNALRQSTSNYKDVSLYGDFNTKWSHSLLPTPTNPLSPLRAIFDPYWLEKLHYNDRPYPVTGHMFEDGTPWGAVLNPTVGELIKPVRRMHEKRLNKDGVDVKRIIEDRNKEILNKANGNQYLIKWKNNEPELVDFTSFNAPTPSERNATAQIQNGEVVDIKGGDYGQYNGGASPEEMMKLGEEGQRLDTPVHLLNSEAFISGKGSDSEENGLSLSSKLTISAAKGNPLAKIGEELIKSVHPVSQISDINKEIIDRAMYKGDQGVLTPEPIHYTTGKAGSKQNEILNDPDAMTDLLTANSGDKYVHEMAMSARNISGIYGWLSNAGVGFGDNNKKILATSQDMSSASRSFWDTAVGGVGGEGSEIGRRFFQEFRRGSRVNPLRNTMPDWMPDRFRYSDPFTLIPDGEARLPGRGYTSLYKLHPDQFGDYGAFDRMKILADISPQSPEYRIWAQIASKTVIDDNLRKEMKNIKKRRSESAKQHEFYDYKFLGRGLDYHNGTVTDVIDNNHFKIAGDKTVYRLAGVRVLNGADGSTTLDKHLSAGMDITLAVDENKFYRGNDDDQKTINAAVFVGGDNLAQKLLEEGTAKVRKGDTSAAGTIAQYSALRRVEGKVLELIAHIDVPYFSDKYARIRSPLESYKAEQVYGTPYQTWSDPIGTYLLPAWERAISSDNGMIMGAMGFAFSRKVDKMASPSKTLRYASNAAYMLSNRGAFIGSTLGYILNMKMGKTAKKLADVGALATFVGYSYVHEDGAIARGTLIGGVGYGVAKMLGKNKILGVFAGASIGIIDAVKNKITGSGKEWVPDRVKNKWDLEEYFDRLNYIKFMGLYKKAAEKAGKEENIDLDKLIEMYSESADKKKELKKNLEDAKKRAKAYMSENDPDRKAIIHEINQKLENISDSQMVMKSGKWTHTALLYRQAALSTMFGAKSDASWMDLIRAVPKNERDYFLEFVKEKDPEKQAEMLKTASPYLTRALQIAWGQKPKDMETNESYFGKHKLPTAFWSGWRPETDLQNVEIKTIRNEGMLLGDFGFFESQLRDPDVINAPNIKHNGHPDGMIQVRSNLKSILNGSGLKNVDIDVQEKDSDSGVSVTFNYIKETAKNFGSTVSNAVSNALSF